MKWRNHVFSLKYHFEWIETGQKVFNIYNLIYEFLDVEKSKRYWWDIYWEDTRLNVEKNIFLDCG